MRIPIIALGLVLAVCVAMYPALWGKPLPPILAILTFGASFLLFFVLGSRAFSNDKSPAWLGTLFATEMFLGTFIRYRWVLERDWSHAAGIAVLGSLLGAVLITASETLRRGKKIGA